MSTLYSIVLDAISELQEWATKNPGEEPNDEIHEIANSATPVNYGDIWAVADSAFNDIVLRVPECGPAFDGSATVINILAGNIYEYIERALYDNWPDIKRTALKRGEQEEE